MAQKTIILAAGGTGGHVFPAVALSETLIRRGWTIFFVTDSRGAVFAKELPQQVHKMVVDLPNPWSGGILTFIMSLYFLVKSLIFLVIFFRTKNVTSIIGFGGYPSAASMVAASILRIPSVIHEQNSVLGRVNKFFANKVDLLVFGIKPMAKLCKTKKVLFLGNPIRQAILNVPPTEYTQLDSENFVLLVLGGSQGAGFVSSIVCETIIALPEKVRERIRIFHQCRQEDLIEVKHKYSKHSINFTAKIFFEEIQNHLNAANLVVSRAGASSLAEFCFFGKPSILIPLPTSVGNHQAKNAYVMEEAGASLVVNQQDASVIDLSNKILFLFNNIKIATDMSMSAKQLAKPNAAENIADELDKLKKRDA